MKSPIIGTEEVGDQTCALCGSEVPEHKHAFVDFDDQGEFRGVAFTDGRKKVLHRCGKKFKLPVIKKI